MADEANCCPLPLSREWLEMTVSLRCSVSLMIVIMIKTRVEPHGCRPAGRAACLPASPAGRCMPVLTSCPAP
eukprot:2324468-Lingulodinium_polyedra.AAC.1